MFKFLRGLIKGDIVDHPRFGFMTKEEFHEVVKAEVKADREWYAEKKAHCDRCVSHGCFFCKFR